MAALIVELANDVKDALTATTFSETVTISRTYNPGVRLTDFRDDTPPALTVIPGAHVQSRISRRSHFADHAEIDVGLRARCTTESRADQLAALTESVLNGIAENLDSDWPLIRLSTDPIFDPESLQTHRLWFSVVRAAFGLDPREAR